MPVDQGTGLEEVLQNYTPKHAQGQPTAKRGWFSRKLNQLQMASFKGNWARAAAMVDPWWALLGAAIPAIIAGQAFRMKKKSVEEQRLKSARGREKSSDEIFVCERVCTSKRMLKKVGAFSKDPTVDSCVTVCGVSELDACADACARTVCVNQHQVPNWNDVCLKRCQNECLRLSNSSVAS
ncbi:hypothetical protein GH714_018113 [Hevea brasiliensis]|uniref:Uncharacterized protein n=1 Tax=Hevea brasiliensis TaxID=3981 RepID=A0A6A6N4B3_HEVBR|nr:hypothetical protein GH714_018113 [Hevea brasiliensis]